LTNSQLFVTFNPDFSRVGSLTCSKAVYHTFRIALVSILFSVAII